MSIAPAAFSAIWTTSALLSLHGKMLEWCSNGPTKTTGLPDQRGEAVRAAIMVSVGIQLEQSYTFEIETSRAFTAARHLYYQLVAL